MTMKAIMYGAGNIGRGFIGQLFCESGYETVFVDINEEFVNLLNKNGEYPVKIVGNDVNKEVIVKNVRAVNAMDSKSVAEEIADCAIMCTAVGVNVLPRIAKNLALGIQKRKDKGNGSLNIIICENLIGADTYLKKLIEEELPEEYQSYMDEEIGFVEASVGRMVPIMTEEMKEGNPLKVWVEEFCTLPVDREAFKGEIQKIKGMVPSSPFEYNIQSKLFLHNMGHALAAYFGSIKGYQYIWQAVEDSEIYLICSNAMHASALALSKEHKKSYAEVEAYADNLLNRFGNKYLGDTCARVGRDTKRKLSANDRLVGAVYLCKKHGIPCDGILRGIAAALLFDSDDEGTKEIRNMVKTRGAAVVLSVICRLKEQSDEFVRIIELQNEIKHKPVHDMSVNAGLAIN